MTYVLSRPIIKSIIREEIETAKRYSALAKIYHIPVLEKMARQEASHALVFKRILNNWQ